MLKLLSKLLEGKGQVWYLRLTSWRYYAYLFSDWKTVNGKILYKRLRV